MTQTEALKLIADIASGSTTVNSLQHIAKIAQEALSSEPMKAQSEQEQRYGQKGKCNRIMPDGKLCQLNAPCPDCGMSLIDYPKPEQRNASEHLEPVAVYGYCPECGAEGVARERRPNGNDCCANGHTYPSRTSNKTPQRTWVGLVWNEMPEIYMNDKAFEHGAKWAEAKLKEKNT